MYPLHGALSGPYVPVRVTRSALVLHRYTYAPPFGGGWMICNFSNIKVHFVFCQLNFIVLFPFLIKYYHILFIIIVFLLGCDRLTDLFYLCTLCFFPYSRHSSYHLRLFLCLISFLLFICASVWETLVHESPISCSHTEWYLHLSRYEIAYQPKLCLSKSNLTNLCTALLQNLAVQQDFYYLLSVPLERSC